MRRVALLVLVSAAIGLGLVCPWRPEPAAAEAEAVQSPAPIELTCRPPKQAPRTYVGFPDGQDWASEFGVAAVEAERIVHAAKLQACGLLPRQDRGGTLRAALHDSAVAITAVLFRGSDLAVADVRMQRVGRQGAAGWSLRVVRAPEGAWQVVSARSERATSSDS